MARLARIAIGFWTQPALGNRAAVALAAINLLDHRQVLHSHCCAVCIILRQLRVTFGQHLLIRLSLFVPFMRFSDA